MLERENCQQCQCQGYEAGPRLAGSRHSGSRQPPAVDDLIQDLAQKPQGKHNSPGQVLAFSAELTHSAQDGTKRRSCELRGHRREMCARPKFIGAQTKRTGLHGCGPSGPAHPGRPAWPGVQADQHHPNLHLGIPQTLKQGFCPAQSE